MVLEEVELDFIRTPQDVVYRDRINYYKKCYERKDEIPPIKVIPFGEHDFLLIVNGNHRAKAQSEIGRGTILVDVLERSYKIGGLIKEIKDLVVLPGDRNLEEGFHLPKLVW